MLSLLTLNIQAASLPRAKLIMEWLDSRDDDLIILTETSNGTGTEFLLAQCRAAGLGVVHTKSSDGDRGCAIIGRVPVTADPTLTARVSLPGRAVAVRVATQPAISVLGLYVPSSDRAPTKVAKKRTFLTTVASGLAALALAPAERAHLVVGGDYNVIDRDHQPPYKAFLPFEYEFLDTLGQLGLTDTHRDMHPDRQVYSWFGRGANGYRFDYFHTGAALTSRVTACDYLQEPRRQALTDHAAVTLSLDIAGAARTNDGRAIANAGALF